MHSAVIRQCVPHVRACCSNRHQAALRQCRHVRQCRPGRQGWHMHGNQQNKMYLYLTRQGTLQQLYGKAMQMEVDFFSAQPDTNPPSAVRLLVVDFDDTCTASDTTSKVFDTAIAATVESAPDGKQDDMQQQLQSKKQDLVENYIREQQKLYAEILPEATLHADVVDQQKAKAFVDSLTSFDRRMNQVVVESGILKGVPEGRLRSAGEQIGLQAGCLSVLARAQQAGVPTHVVSVNYSTQMVIAALQRGNLNIVSADDISVEAQHDVVVHANELAYQAGVSTGDIIRRIEGGSDKDKLISQLLQTTHIASSTTADGESTSDRQCATANSSSPNATADRQSQSTAAAVGSALTDATASSSGQTGADPKLAVYIGDSPSDLAPLLRADVGIVVGQNKLLRQVAKALGIKLKPLTAAPAHGRGEEGSLYEAESWAAIGAFLFGPDPSRALTPHPSSASTLEKKKKVPRVMTVAGSDSGGGAGIQADLKTYQARGVFGMSAISALTAQNTRGVRGVHTVPTSHLSDQMEAVLTDIGADVVKTGMLPTAEAVKAVADAVRAHKVSTLVVDPVLVATSGDSLAGSEVAEALKTHLFPLATLITPNLPEASALLGSRHVATLDSMKQAAKDLHKLGPKYVLVKGGHLISPPTTPTPGTQGSVNHAQQGLATAANLASASTANQTLGRRHTPDSAHEPQSESISATAQDSASKPSDDVSQPELHSGSTAAEQVGSESMEPVDNANTSQLHRQTESSDEATPSGEPQEKQESTAPAVDVLFDGTDMHVLESKRIHTHNTHGTGCTLASAIAAELAKGQPPLAAVRLAKGWLGQALQASAPLQIGSGPHGPLNHGFEVNDWGGNQGSLKHALDLRLYAVTDPACNVKQQRSNTEAVRKAIEGGVTLVQLREKSADGGAFVQEALKLVELAKPSGVGIIINDRVDVALASGAHGVHVGQDDLSAKAARTLLGPNKILGVSVKTVEQAQQAAADGADYLGAGAMFATATKDSSTITFETLKQICAAVDVPVVAIGGITAENAQSCIQAGCHGVAVVSAIFAAEDAAAAAQQIRKAVDSALSDR